MSFHRNQPLEVGLTPRTKRILEVHEQVKKNLELPHYTRFADNYSKLMTDTACEKRLQHFRSTGNAKISVEK